MQCGVINEWTDWILDNVIHVIVAGTGGVHLGVY